MDYQVLIHSGNINRKVLITDKKKYIEKLEQLQQNELKSE